MHIPTVILVLLWLQTRTSGSAATVPLLNADAGTDTLQAHDVQLPAGNLGTSNTAEIVNYPIPGTTTTIHFILGRPLPPAVMANTIISAYNYINATIASKGDSLLPKSKDPFTYSKGHGAFIRAGSAKGRHLTWSLLEGAVVGLWNGLYLNGRYRASDFWIQDSIAGLVGVGEMGIDVVGGEWRNGTALESPAKVEEGKGNGNGSSSGGVVD